MGKKLKSGDNIVWFPATGAIVISGQIIEKMNDGSDIIVGSIQEFKNFCDFVAGQFGLSAGKVNGGNRTIAVCPVVE